MKTISAISCLLLAVTSMAACTDDDDVLDPPIADASADRSSDARTTSDAATSDAAGDALSAEATTAESGDDAESDDASADAAVADQAAADAASIEAAADAGNVEAAADALGDAPTIEAGPGGDGGLVLGGDGSAADGTFRLSAVVGANLLSSSDVRPDCAIAASGGVAANYLLTCQERSGAAGPCRTVEVEFRIDASSGPRTGDRYTAVIQAAPSAVNQAVVRYRESIDCSAATSNGWIQAAPGGDLTVDVGGDTATVFTLHDVAMGPAPRGALNQNAQGTFTLGGNGTASGSFQ